MIFAILRLTGTGHFIIGKVLFDDYFCAAYLPGVPTVALRYQVSPIVQLLDNVIQNAFIK
jgi:hypothetical protein